MFWSSLLKSACDCELVIYNGAKRAYVIAIQQSPSFLTHWVLTPEGKDADPFIPAVWCQQNILNRSWTFNIYILLGDVTIFIKFLQYNFVAVWQFESLNHSTCLPNAIIRVVKWHHLLSCECYASLIYVMVCLYAHLSQLCHCVLSKLLRTLHEDHVKNVYLLSGYQSMVTWKVQLSLVYDAGRPTACTYT